MERRGFLRALVGGIAATAAVRTWPFRVYSFPSEITLAQPDDLEFYMRSALNLYANHPHYGIKLVNAEIPLIYFDGNYNLKLLRQYVEGVHA